MRRLHGRDWRLRAGAPRGRLRRHVGITVAGLGGLGLALAGRRRAAVAAAVCVAGVAELAAARIAPGPKTCPEVRQMLLTSAVIPFAATWHAVRGAWRHRRARPWRGLPEAVLFDRDGTLVRDVPYNGDPGRVTPVPGARQALDRLRQAGVRVGVVTNQSGVAQGLISRSEVDAVNGRVECLLGPFDDWQMCVHGPDDGCLCRKPLPGLVSRACIGLSVDPGRCVVIGDTGADMAAAEAAGAVGILVPNAATRSEEVVAASLVCDGVPAAVDRVMGGAW
jgi:histidinol-phosphate phosphatase family protein